MSHKTKRSPLHNAIIDEQIEAISDLIKKKADVNVKDDKNITPLHLAVRLSNIRIIKLLLEAGADVLSVIGDNDDGITPLSLAINSNDESIVKCFLESIGDVNIKDNDGITPIHLAAKWGNLKILKLLIDFGADVNAKDNFERTPLMRSCESAVNLNIVKLLIDAGADVTTQDEGGLTPLHWTAESEDVNLSKLLIEAGANVNATDNYYATPVHEAAAWGFPGVLKLLIASGGAVYMGDDSDDTPLHSAARTGNICTLDTLIDAGANIDAVNFMRRTPLHVAVDNEKLNFSKNLVDAGAEINTKERIRLDTPLHLAAKKGNVDILQLLVCAGAKVNEYNKQGDTSLSLFMKYLSENETPSKNSYIKGVKLLIECTDINLLNKNENNFLKVFLKWDSFSSVRKFFYKIILKHIAIVRTLNLLIDEDLMNTISEKNDYRNYFAECIQELEKAKSTKIQNCWVTFFDLLVDNKFKLSKYAGNADLIKGFVKFMDEFPIYGNTMQSNVSTGIFSRESFDGAANMLSYHLPIFASFHLIIKDILDILCQKDWKKLCTRKRTSE